MARRTLNRTEQGEEENVFWVTMSDMFLGMMMVFMTLFVFAMTGFSQNKLKQQALQSEVAQELTQKLQEQNITATVDNLTSQVKISDLELFELNSYTLSPKGKKYLDKFMPIYLNTIFSKPELYNQINNIVVQGYTDTQSFKNIRTKDGQFIKNMDLSLKRANAVAEYIFSTGYNKKYLPKITKTLIVEGKSYADPIMVNGKEDYDKSRRVELKLVVKEDSDLPNFLGFGS